MSNVHVLEREVLERIVARENLMRAWQRVKGNKGAAGCDEVSVLEFPAWARAHWPKIKSQLMEGSVFEGRRSCGAIKHCTASSAA